MGILPRYRAGRRSASAPHGHGEHGDVVEMEALETTIIYLK